MSIFPKKIEDKFTSNLKNVLKASEDIAVEMSNKEIGVEHVVFSIILQEGSIGSNVIATKSLNIKKLKEKIDKMEKSTGKKVGFSSEMKPIFQDMVIYANRYEHSYIGTEHLLFAILSSDNPKLIKLFREVGIEHDKIKTQLDAILESSMRFSGIMEISSENRKGIATPGIPGISSFGMPGISSDSFQSGALGVSASVSKQSAIEAFCVCVNDQVEDEKFDTVIGRDEEIAKVINILSRKSKNNPILIGEPGVGKTAIVQGLVQKIIDGDVPSNLSNKKVYSLDLGLLIAGTVFRGEFESRLKDVIAESQEDPNVILFIDEIHTIIGAGNTGGSGSLDAANILKPPLSRGEISCIGATTVEEYRKHFKKDAALDRRFQMVLVEEPNIEEAEKVLSGIKSFYEKHHNVKITSEAIHASVIFSQRFINDRFLPDKALDVLDEACALVRSRYGNKNYFKDIKKLKKKRDILSEEKEDKIENGKYEEALKVKKEEEKIIKEIMKFDKLQEKENSTKIKVPVTDREIGEVVEQMTGVPVNDLLSEERKKLKNLEKELKKEIVGQDEAIETIAKSIRRSRSGITEGNRPIGVFMFLGPTGVGKTELVKVLSEKMYKDKKSLIRVDMSEFMERHNVSRLVGAPAGYVGFEEGGKLTEEVRLHPYSVILFDEVEKAHPDTFNIMLQIFEDGELTDAAGHKVDFRNTMIIMTSNLGTEELTNEAELGFSMQGEKNEDGLKDEARDKYMEAKEDLIANIKEEFRPEFINRIDKIVVFNPLSRKDIEKILRIKFKKLADRIFDKKGISLEINEKALNFLSKESFDPNEGARLIRRNLESMVEDQISEKIVDGRVGKGDKLNVLLEKNRIVIK